MANANQYHLKENAEKVNNEQLSQINQEVAQLATNVQNTLKKPIEDDFSSVLSGIDELEEKIDHSQEIGQRRMTISSALKQGPTRFERIEFTTSNFVVLKLMSKIWPIMMLCIKTH